MAKEFLIEQAIQTAREWQNKAIYEHDFDQNFQFKMQKLIKDTKGKALLVELLDEAFRSKNYDRVARQIVFLLKRYKGASFFLPSEQALLWLFENLGVYVPKLSVPLFVGQIRNNTKTVVIQGEETPFNTHLQKRQKEGTQVNVNLIGETVLGEKEANKRIQGYFEALKNPNISYISIKISTIFSQINPLSFEDTVLILVEKLTLIFIQAQKHKFKNKNGIWENKFINLDMEEYQDLAITVEVFMCTLDKEQFKNFKAGLVLQAYLPDSSFWQKKFTTWAKQRVANGGCAVKLRLVKGANMEMEHTQACLKNWPMTTFEKKVDTDSHYKVMTQYALESQNIKAVHMGFASHNIFELAYVFELAKENNVLDYVNFEMLEGINEGLYAVIKELGVEVILYAPVAKKEQFTNAVAYLVRRLDENTSKQNFMCHAFGLKVDSEAWNCEKQKFLDAFENMKNITNTPKRGQDRSCEDWSNFKGSPFFDRDYSSEPDTDFVLSVNQKWAQDIAKKWQKNPNDEIPVIPVVIGGQSIFERPLKEALDKSQLPTKVVVGHFAQANLQDLQQAVQTAHLDATSWRKLTHTQRHEVLSRVANKVREKRGDLIGIAAAEVGKVFIETDVEVSEAVDFLEFYPYAVRHFEDNYPNLKMTPKNVGVVVSPWNFPIAIAAGGIAAGLAAGNTVILKPSSASALCAYELCKCFWEAGIAREVLQFVPCENEVASVGLIENEKVDFVILTGSEATAFRMLEKKPNVFLTAETGGKDATIVTAMADREQAIKNVCQSAFLNSGQKCSATSLLILEEEVYEDENFKQALVDAAKSMNVGSVWDFKNKIGTLANEIKGALKTAIESLEDGESWALPPEFANNNPYMLKPAIKWGVQENSFCHKTELFGPVLAVMKAKNLQHAVDLVNATDYGLTSGLESLDEREIEYWKKSVKAGNLYINRSTTGAIVLRQPFGGLRKSAVGSGRKVGVYNYVTQFMHIEELQEPKIEQKHQHLLDNLIQNWLQEEKYTSFKKDFLKLQTALQSYISSLKQEFEIEHDYFKILGESNIFRYLPLKKVALKVCECDSLFDVLARIFAAKLLKIDLHVSVEWELDNAVTRFIFENEAMFFSKQDTLCFEREENFVNCFSNAERILYTQAQNISDFVFQKATQQGHFIVRQIPLMYGRLELLNFLEEQSISYSYHRYGNTAAKMAK